jgi:hypothetical protein
MNFTIHSVEVMSGKVSKTNHSCRKSRRHYNFITPNIKSLPLFNCLANDHANNLCGARKLVVTVTLTDTELLGWEIQVASHSCHAGSDCWHLCEPLVQLGMN